MTVRELIAKLLETTNLDHTVEVAIGTDRFDIDQYVEGNGYRPNRLVLDADDRAVASAVGATLDSELGEG